MTLPEFNLDYFVTKAMELYEWNTVASWTLISVGSLGATIGAGMKLHERYVTWREKREARLPILEQLMRRASRDRLTYFTFKEYGD